MLMLRVILIILAIVCFAMSALGVSTPRGNLVAAGLALWALATLIT
jgi:hypothetical protein